MYSKEIEELLRYKKFIIDSKEYIKIIDTSPQIDHIKYNPYDDTIDIYTTDDYYFKVKVKNKRGV